MRGITPKVGCAVILTVLVCGCRPTESQDVRWEPQSAHYVTARDGVQTQELTWWFSNTVPRAASLSCPGKR